MLSEVNDVPVSVLPIDGFKAHLRMGSGFGTESLQDNVLESFLRAAIAAIEARTGKALIARDFHWVVRQWARSDCVVLPIAPVTAIVAVVLIDAQGGETPLDLSDFRLVHNALEPKLEAVSGSLPTPVSGGAVRVRLTAGFGAQWGNLPSDLAQAVMMLAAHFYEHRDATTLGAGCMPFGVSSLIERYRLVRLGGGAHV
jgi:uncharacterized phiE125 gp8 family phage protein